MQPMEKTPYLESSETPCQIDELLSALKQIKRHPRGYHGIHLKFSRLDRAHKQPYHRRAIATAFNKLIQQKVGQLFWTHEFDMIFFCQSSSPAQIDTAVIGALRAVEDSPVIKEYVTNGQDDELCDRFDLEHDLERFMAMAQDLKKPEDIGESPEPSLESLITGLDQRLSPAKKSKTEQVAPTQTKAKKTTQPVFPAPVIKDTRIPLGPQQLDQLERNLVNLDINQMVTDQTAYVIAGNATPQPIFTEYFISVKKVTKILLPGYNIKADKWLFQRLTRTFDTKILQTLPEKELPTDQVISLNINVDTILSTEFDQFFNRYKKQNIQPLILEMQLFDVISDIQKYYDARQKVTDLSCRISLDAVNIKSLAVLDRQLLDVDFLKMSWLSCHPKKPDKAEINEFINTIADLGKMRIILCHCDTDAALEFGKTIGIHMYQGFLIDKMVAG